MPGRTNKPRNLYWEQAVITWTYENWKPRCRPAPFVFGKNQKNYFCLCGSVITHIRLLLILKGVAGKADIIYEVKGINMKYLVVFIILIYFLISFSHDRLVRAWRTVCWIPKRGPNCMDELMTPLNNKWPQWKRKTWSPSIFPWTPLFAQWHNIFVQ